MNKMLLSFSAESKNESVARACVAAFMLSADPTVEAVNDVKTAVSEAVTNCVVHAYPDKCGEIMVECYFEDDYIVISVKDHGVGIDDVEKATQPFFTTRAEDERSGLGFTVIRSFTDDLKVYSEAGGGTCVIMKKRLIRSVENA